mgnify:CR=1 FL=1
MRTLALLLALAAPRPEPLLVEVTLVGVRSIVVQAEMTADSALRLPGREVAQLLGVSPFGDQVTPRQIAETWAVRVDVDWRALRVVIDDQLERLPATRALRDRVRLSARSTTPSAPYLAAAGDDRGGLTLDAGYSWRGVAWVGGQFSTPARGLSWTASVSPPHVWIQYAQGDSLPAQVTGHVAVGPVWVGGTWSEVRSLRYDGLLRVGPLFIYGAPPERRYALTARLPWGISAQIGRDVTLTSVRVVMGAFPISPFGVQTLSH